MTKCFISVMQLGLHSNTCSLKHSEMDICVFPAKFKHHQGFLLGIFISLFLNLDNVSALLFVEFVSN